ncbi:unnamed protein product, partial [Effrenium voratum]
MASAASLLGSCFEGYFLTPVEELEVRRMQLGALLLALFASEALRLATGQLLSVPGLVVCLVGNRARCSLRPWDLGAFLALGGSVAVLDVVSLAGILEATGFQAPSARAPCQRVAFSGAVAAPLLELMCLKVAWGSYVTRDHFFVPGPSYG